MSVMVRVKIVGALENPKHASPHEKLLGTSPQTSFLQTNLGLENAKIGLVLLNHPPISQNKPILAFFQAKIGL